MERDNMIRLFVGKMKSFLQSSDVFEIVECYADEDIEDELSDLASQLLDVVETV